MRRSTATSTGSRRQPSSPTFRFVGGKGGVGKTTCAAALGLAAARAGQPTLIVSTDPAPSLGDALHQRLGAAPRAVRGVRHLHAVEVDATSALEAWLAERRGLLETIALRGSWLDADDVSQLLRLSLPGIDEIAGLLKIGDFADSGRYAHIVVDTAPTGHLLRMLAMPSVLEALAAVFDRMQGKHRILVDALRGGWVPDAADTLIQRLDQQARGLAALLRDPERCRFAWVTLAEDMAIEETADGIRWLSERNIRVDRVVVNRLTPSPRSGCDWCRGRRALEARALTTLRRLARGTALHLVPAATTEPVGIAALARLGRALTAPARFPLERAHRRPEVIATVPASASTLDSALLVPDGIALVMFGGKGGVGKTTCAAATAIGTARRNPGRRVVLLSADPAHSVGDVLKVRLSDHPQAVPGAPQNLAVRELDAARSFSAVRDRLARGVDDLIRRVGGRDSDRQAIGDLLDLAPPGVDELVAIMEVLDSAGAAARIGDLIVIDTAPTGHALRLLEMPALIHDWVKTVMRLLLKYQPVTGIGELGATLLELSQGIGRLRALLVDERLTRFIAVTRAELLPRAETTRLLARLHAVSIPVPFIIVNAVGAGTCARCRRDRRQQAREIAALARALSQGPPGSASIVTTPGVIPPPAGPRELQVFLTRWQRLPGVAGR